MRTRSWTDAVYLGAKHSALLAGLSGWLLRKTLA
jgi:hypothetical protein